MRSSDYQKRVSIVVSNWNRRKEVERTINSIVCQDYPNFNLVIVDNHSSDGSIEYFRSFIQSNPGFDVYLHIMESCDYTAMETLNLGFRYADGDYILVMDNDAFMAFPNCLSQLVNSMESDDRIAVVSAHVKSHSDEAQLQILNEHGVAYCTKDMDTFGSLYDTYDFHGACSLFRTDALKEMGYYDESFILYLNEIDLGLKFLGAGYRVVYDPNALAFHPRSMKARRQVRYAIFYSLRNYNHVICRNTNSRLHRFMLYTLRHTLTLSLDLRFIWNCERDYFWQTFNKVVKCMFSMAKDCVLEKAINPKNDKYIVMIIKWHARLFLHKIFKFIKPYSGPDPRMRSY